jgi:hypothetical protein
MGKLAIFIGGLVLGAVGAFVGLLYLEMHKQPPDDQIVFAPKNFVDVNQPGTESGSVAISGTLTGSGLAYPNNTYVVSCQKEWKACVVSYVAQIGHNQIGRMEYPYPYPIVKWTNYEVIAQEEPNLFGCRRVTITIDRQSKALLWLEEPVNQTKPNCKNADTNIRKYSIEDLPAWQAMRKR